MKLNWFVKKYAEWRKIVRFQINQAIQDHGRKMRAIGIEEGRKENPVCLCCPYYLSAKANTVHVESPVLTTSGKLPVEGIRQRAFRHQLNMQPPGTMLHHDTTMKRKAAITRQLDPDTISALPIVQPPQPRKVNLRATDDDFML